MSATRRGLILGLGAPTLVLCLTTIVSHSFGRITYGLLIPAIEDDLSLSHGQSGLGGTTIYAAYAIGVLLIAIMAPRVEPITLMKVGIGTAALGFAVLTMANSLWALLVGLGLAGGAGAAIWITAPVLATAGAPANRRGLIIGLLSATIGLSGVALGLLTPAIRTVVGDDGAWRPIWALEAVLSLALVAAIAVIVKVERTERVEAGFDLDLLRSVPGWLQLTAAYALFGGLTAGFGSFLFAALEEDAGLSRTGAAGVLSGMSLLGVIGAPTTGALSDRLGRPRLMVLSLSVLTAACLGVALGTGLVVYISALAYGSLAGSYPALVASYVRDHLDNRAFGRAFATMLLFFSAVAIVVPSVIGALADATDSFSAAYGLLALLGLAAVACTTALPRLDADPG